MTGGGYSPVIWLVISREWGEGGDITSHMAGSGHRPVIWLVISGGRG